MPKEKERQSRSPCKGTSPAEHRRGPALQIPHALAEYGSVKPLTSLLVQQMLLISRAIFSYKHLQSISYFTQTVGSELRSNNHPPGSYFILVLG